MSELKVCGLVVSILLAGNAGAELLFDPMRPYSGQAPVVPGAQSKVGFALSAIVYSPERRVAVINGKPVAEGAKISGATVRRIERGRVELQYEGKLLELKLSTLRKFK